MCCGSDQTLTCSHVKRHSKEVSIERGGCHNSHFAHLLYEGKVLCLETDDLHNLNTVMLELIQMSQSVLHVFSTARVHKNKRRLVSQPHRHTCNLITHLLTHIILHTTVITVAFLTDGVNTCQNHEQHTRPKTKVRNP